MPCTVQSGHTQTTISDYEINSYKITRNNIFFIWDWELSAYSYHRRGDEVERLVHITWEIVLRSRIFEVLRDTETETERDCVRYKKCSGYFDYECYVGSIDVQASIYL